MADQPIRTYRQRIRGRTTHLRSILDAIDERTARADTSTIAPRNSGTHDRVQTSSYADPTSLTVGERDDLLGTIERDLWAAEEHLHQTARRLAIYAPNRDPDLRCKCPPECCDDGCTRHVTDGRDEHPTCRQKRSRARRRGEPWALEEPA